MVRLRGETALREIYGASNEIREIFEEQVTVTVPPNTGVRLTLRWKTLLQQGYLQLQEPAGRILEVPFQVAVGVTFDQQQARWAEPD